MKKKRFSVEQIVAVLKQAEPLFQNGMNTQADQPCGYCAFAKIPSVTTAFWFINCTFVTDTIPYSGRKITKNLRVLTLQPLWTSTSECIGIILPVVLLQLKLAFAAFPAFGIPDIPSNSAIHRLVMLI